MANKKADKHFSDGVIKSVEGNYQGALADFTKVIELEADNAGAYYNRGLTTIYLTLYQSAITDYSKAIKMDIDIRYYFKNIESVISKDKYGDNVINKQYKKAIKDFDDAIKLQPEHAHSYYYRGGAYRFLGKEKQATKDLKKAKELDSTIIIPRVAKELDPTIRF